MHLSDLLVDIAVTRPALAADAARDPVIRGLAYDSRQVKAGDLFFALPGSEVDGHDYLPQALAHGAAALVVERIPDGLDAEGIPVAVVADSRRAMAPIATRYYGAPSNELQLIGVTGTNGKTSTAYLVESILARAGRRVGLIGTVEIRYDDVRKRSINTTPESLDLQQTLRAMRNHEIEAVVMEVSSHGLEMGRVEGCRFAVASIGNVTQDHLDFHGTMEAYRRSKERLFERYLDGDGVAVVNLDDASAPSFLAAAERSGAKILRVTRDAERDAEVRLRSAEVDLGGTRAEVDTPVGTLAVELPLVGDFNLENMLVACGAAIGAGADADAIVAGVAACPQVPGRVERIAAEDGAGPTVIVDYAHTPDAVEKLLRTLRPLATARLITVFGCGGDRDRGKRPLMAQAVARYSDLVIATSDNPRTEDPERILADVEAGLSELARVKPEELGAAPRSATTLTDRREAIQRAVEIANPDDMVVIAGKGHEDYQIVGRTKLPFDDCQEAANALARRSGR